MPISVPAAMQVSVANVADRASGYGIPGVVVDGTDVLACYRASRDAVARARAGKGPSLIEAKVTRLTAHSSDDQQTKSRSAEELAAELGRLPNTNVTFVPVDLGGHAHAATAGEGSGG